MAGNARLGNRRVAKLNLLGEFDERLVLFIGIGNIITAFKLNANRVIITPFSPCKTRRPSMPSSCTKGDETEQLPHLAESDSVPIRPFCVSL